MKRDVAFKRLLGLLLVAVLLLPAITSCTGCGRSRHNGRQVHSSSRKAPGKQQNQSTMTGTQIYNKYNSAVFKVYTSDGYEQYTGSGFFVNSKGKAVSNFHVFDGTFAEYVQIQLADGGVYALDEVIAYSEEEDFIVFTVAARDKAFDYIPISQRNVMVGEKVYAIGSPLGLNNTFSSGEVSNLWQDKGIIQINAPIDHGSSGGALLNAYGEVIGITSAGFDESNANLNFAINIHKLDKYLK